MKEDEKENRKPETMSLRVSPTAAWEVAKAATHLAKKTVGPALGDIMVSASPAAASAVTAATGGGAAASGLVGSAFAGTALGTACAVAAPAGQAVGIAYGLMKICTAIWD